MPTWITKLTPFPRFSRSFSGGILSRAEGVRRSSSSVKIHCVSAARRISLGREGGIFEDGEIADVRRVGYDVPGMTACQ